MASSNRRDSNGLPLLCVTVVASKLHGHGCCGRCRQPAPPRQLGPNPHSKQPLRRPYALSRLKEYCCLTSTEASRPIRNGDEWERGKEECNLETGADAEDQGCRGPPPEQQNVNYIRQCPPGIAQQLPYHAIAVPTAMQNRVTNNGSERSLTLKPSSPPCS